MPTFSLCLCLCLSLPPSPPPPALLPFSTGSPVIQAGLELILQLRMTWNSTFHLTSTGVQTGAPQLFYPGLGVESGPPVCQASTFQPSHTHNGILQCYYCISFFLSVQTSVARSSTSLLALIKPPTAQPRWLITANCSPDALESSAVSSR